MRSTLLHRISRDANSVLYGDSLAKGAWTAGMGTMKAGGICGDGSRWGRRLRAWSIAGTI